MLSQPLASTKSPETVEEFFAALEKIKDEGTYTPLAMGTSDLWEAATMGFQNIGPNYWKGEEGRQALIDGTAKFTDQPYVDTWAQLAKWAPYMPAGFEAVKYPDSQVLFTSGKAAIYPTGSWEICVFEKDATFPMGIFKPPVPKAGDHLLHQRPHRHRPGHERRHQEPRSEAKTFLEWVASPEFAELYSNALPGFFTLSNA